jgi:hypothetical protein
MSVLERGVLAIGRDRSIDIAGVTDGMGNLPANAC